MKEISLLDTSTFESHLDGLVGVMSIMAIAQREELYHQAWENIVELVNTREDLTLEEKYGVLKDAEKNLGERVDDFIKSRKAKGYFKKEDEGVHLYGYHDN